MSDKNINDVEYITYTLTIPKYKIVDYKFSQSNDYLQTELIHQLEKENKQLKKQLEEYKKWYQDELEENYKLSELWCDSRAKIRELANQQKEFIEYLEESIKLIKQGNPVNITEYTSAKLDILEEILSKYKSIIGGKE